MQNLRCGAGYEFRTRTVSNWRISGMVSAMYSSSQGCWVAAIADKKARASMARVMCRGTGYTESDRGHGRSERRTVRTALADGVDFPGAVQVMRIVRHVADLRGSGSSKRWPMSSRTCPSTWPDPPI
ncbi:hypothetical protein ABT352_01465 [Streptosporangium sp. NPDC000563]|uniref:hypothetical protein n=1 Tax=Streptosporangium sp. NPDC000563 TaxID=3154366 RepID=UPI003327F7D0